PLLQQCGAGIQYGHPALPGGADGRRLRLCAAPVLRRRRRRAQGARSGAASEVLMEQAYGLYTHIQANKRRSVALLVGLFLLVYLMVYAGALVAEALSGDAALETLMRAA